MRKIYIITIVVLISLFGLMMINQSNDGELNDYEIYNPTVEVNESKVEEDYILNNVTELVEVLMLIAVVIGIIGGVIVPIISLGRKELNY